MWCSMTEMKKLTEADVRAKLQEGSKARIIIGAFPEELPNTLDLVILSPGVPTDLPIILKMKEKEIPVIGEVELAYTFGKGDVLAIYRNELADDNNNTSR